MENQTPELDTRRRRRFSVPGLWGISLLEGILQRTVPRTKPHARQSGTATSPRGPPRKIRGRDAEKEEMNSPREGGRWTPLLLCGTLYVVYEHKGKHAEALVSRQAYFYAIPPDPIGMVRLHLHAHEQLNESMKRHWAGRRRAEEPSIECNYPTIWRPSLISTNQVSGKSRLYMNRYISKQQKAYKKKAQLPLRYLSR